MNATFFKTHILYYEFVTIEIIKLLYTYINKIEL